MAKLPDLSKLKAYSGGSKAADATGDVVQTVPLDQLYPDPNQIRKKGSKGFSKKSLEALAQTIKSEGGIKEPIKVHPADADGRNMIGDGERRWRAAKLLGLTFVPMIVSKAFGKKTQMILNLQREDNTPLENAMHLRAILDEDTKLNQKQLALELGVSPAWVSQHLSLLTLQAPLDDLFRLGIVGDLNAVSYLKSALAGEHAGAVADLLQGWISSHQDGDESKPLHEIRDLVRSAVPQAGADSGSQQQAPAENQGHQQVNQSGPSGDSQTKDEAGQGGAEQKQHPENEQKAAPEKNAGSPAPRQNAQPQSTGKDADQKNDRVRVAEVVILVEHDGQLFSLLAGDVAQAGHAVIVRDGEPPKEVALSALRIHSITPK